MKPVHGSDANQLADELSPYLLQHAKNPVAWKPWGEAAFAEALQRDVPVLVSIGYSACHWCHVMEHESFEDPGTAAWMNRNLVCVKVDREERPDLDALYMNFAVALHGHGGWPLNVFVSPERAPFWAGTYFPRERRGNMPAWLDVCHSVSRGWELQKDQIRAGSKDLAQTLSREATGSGGTVPDGKAVRAAFDRGLSGFDPVWGGHPGAPKFPPHVSLDAAMSGGPLAPDALDGLRTTLDRMACGGIRDHVGGGFARYSTDERWLVPHFEKMLYDNALLVSVYSRAARLFDNSWYAEVAKDTADWMGRELGDPLGGFRSALDADSEGEEGTYYLWSWQELEEILGTEIDDFARAWNASRPGNFEGKNILWRTLPPSGSPGEDSREAVWRSSLFTARNHRVRPGLDDKVLASWNGLAIAGLAQTGRFLSDSGIVRRAEAAGNFVLRHLRHEHGLWSVWKNGRSRHPGTLEDWAFLGEGFLELWQATGEGGWLAAALDFAEQILARFQIDPDAPLRLSDRVRDDLFAPVVPLQDGATPSGNGSAAKLLAKLWRLTGKDEFRHCSQIVVEACGDSALAHPRAFPSILAAARILSDSVTMAHLDGDPTDPSHRESAAILRSTPNMDLVAIPASDEPDDALRGGFASETRRVGPMSAIVCRGNACLPPAATPQDLQRLLDSLD